MSKRIFLVSIDTGEEQDDKDLADMFITMISFLPWGVTFKFVRVDEDKEKAPYNL